MHVDVSVRHPPSGPKSKQGCALLRLEQVRARGRSSKTRSISRPTCDTSISKAGSIISANGSSDAKPDIG